MDAVVKAVGNERTAIRISPFGAFMEPASSDALPLFKHYVSELSKRQLLYLHCIEARVGTVQTMFGGLPVPSSVLSLLDAFNIQLTGDSRPAAQLPAESPVRLV